MPIVTQVNPGGDKGDIPPRAKDPPEEQLLSLIRSVYVPSIPLGDMFASRVGRPDSVGGKEDPDGIEEVV